MVSCKTCDEIDKDKNNYQFTKTKFFGTEADIEEIEEEIAVLKKYFLQHESLHNVIEQSNHERSLAIERYDKNSDRIKIYLSLITIFTSVVSYSLLSSMILTTRIFNSNNKHYAFDQIIFFAFAGLFLYPILRSLALMGLALANNESTIRITSTKAFVGAFQAAKKIDKTMESEDKDPYSKRQQYLIAKFIDRSTTSIVNANNHVRKLTSESIIQLIRALSLLFLFLPYLIVNVEEIFMLYVYLALSLLFLMIFVIRDYRTTPMLIKAIFSPVKCCGRG